jgi:hypothetical protein
VPNSVAFIVIFSSHKKYTNKEKKKRKRLYSDENITCKKLHVCVGIAIALTTVARTTTVAYLLVTFVELRFFSS